MEIRINNKANKGPVNECSGVYLPLSDVKYDGMKMSSMVNKSISDVVLQKTTEGFMIRKTMTRTAIGRIHFLD